MLPPRSTVRWCLVLSGLLGISVAHAHIATTTYGDEPAERCIPNVAIPAILADGYSQVMSDGHQRAQAYLTQQSAQWQHALAPLLAPGTAPAFATAEAASAAITATWQAVMHTMRATSQQNMVVSRSIVPLSMGCHPELNRGANTPACIRFNEAFQIWQSDSGRVLRQLGEDQGMVLRAMNAFRMQYPTATPPSMDLPAEPVYSDDLYQPPAGAVL